MFVITFVFLSHPDLNIFRSSRLQMLKRTPAQLFPVDLQNVLNTFFTEHLQTTASMAL